MVYREIWSIDVSHESLGKYRHIQGVDRDVVEQKARAQSAIWEDQWQRKFEANNRKEQSTQRQRSKQSAINEAEALTLEARAAVEAIEKLLHLTLDVNDSIDWNSLKDTTKFREKHPKLDVVSAQPDRASKSYYVENLPDPEDFMLAPMEPNSEDSRFIPKLGFLNRLFTSQARQLELANQAWQKTHYMWAQEIVRIKSNNDSLLQEQGEQVVAREQAVALMDEKFSGDLLKWQTNKLMIEESNSKLRKAFDKRAKYFYANQETTNVAIDAQRDRYFSGDGDAIVDYCDMVLAKSGYPDSFPRESEMDYNAESKVLIVDFLLPSPESMPTLKDVKYQPTKDEFKETYLSTKDANGLYDSALYQIALRTIHELFEADTADALSSIVFNGYVKALEKASGNHVISCVLSVQADKEEFLAFNLKNVDPKECFKALKGVGSAKLHGITAIPPLARIDREDKRFVDSHETSIAIDSSTNLASMDWEDFEHLIREIFEKEFAAGGGEVRVTQASRDGGVDAVIFDPDPIRGGKMVVQAKRYTNTVGVSAVRDLYGTMMNEGAMKGILVTTSSYGADSYEFAKGKPLTLLSGGNLLHLLAKHGHRARIDIAEARLVRV